MRKSKTLVQREKEAWAKDWREKYPKRVVLGVGYPCRAGECVVRLQSQDQDGEGVLIDFSSSGDIFRPGSPRYRLVLERVAPKAKKKGGGRCK